MSCCFSPPKEKYEFGGDSSQSKSNKNKKNKQKKLSATNEQSKAQNDRKTDIITNGENKVEDIGVNGEDITDDIVLNGEDITDDIVVTGDARDGIEQSENTAATSAHDHSSQSDAVHTDIDTGHTDAATENTDAPTKSEHETENIELRKVTRPEDNAQTTAQTTAKTQEDICNNNEPKKEVFVISRAKTNSFYGAAFIRKEEERKQEDERKRLQAEKKMKDEEEMKRKLVALKVANAPKIEIEHVSEKMDENQLPEEPAPDYSDDEHDAGKEEDYVELRKTVKNRVSAMLTRNEWDQILDRAGLDGLEANAVEIPEPDYEGATTRPLGRAHTFNVGGGHQDASKNMSPENKARLDLHREMMMNQKFGIDVLQQKSELQKEFSKRKEKVKLKETETPRRNSFELKLHKMANKMQTNEEGATPNPCTEALDEATPEFLRVHSKIYKAKPTS